MAAKRRPAKARIVVRGPKRAPCSGDQLRAAMIASFRYVPGGAAVFALPLLWAVS